MDGSATERGRERGIGRRQRVCMCVCGRLCERNEPNLTADLARASGAREKALLTTNSLSPRLSHIHTLVESV